MKKSMFRSVSAFLVVVMMLSLLPVAAFAASTFFQRSVGGFTCVGNGTISASAATANLSATANPNEPIVPNENCSSKVWVYTYDSTGRLLAWDSGSGTTYAYASATALNIDNALYKYEFMSTSLGLYTLSN